MDDTRFESGLSPQERCDQKPNTVAWIGDKGTVVTTALLMLADYPTERFGVGCAMCHESLAECECNV